MSQQSDGPGTVRIVHWRWGPDEEQRPGLPWIGIFLVLLGGLLLLQEFEPNLRIAGSAVFLAVGVAFLISWLANRRASALYLGAIITALSLSNVLSDGGVIHGQGWGTLFLGIAFLAIALIRAATGGGWGWQLVFGAILVVSGGSTIAETVTGFPSLSRVALPVLLVVLGLLLLGRGRRLDARY